jgi:hypothetical protein
MLRRSSGSGYEKPQSGYALCAVFLHHIFAVAGIASQFLYRNRKNVIYNRNVMRNFSKFYLDKKNYCGILLFMEEVKRLVPKPEVLRELYLKSGNVFQY